MRARESACASDAAAAVSLGLPAAGRSSCCSGGELLRACCAKWGVRYATIVADADEPGRRGAAALGKLLGLRHRIVLPPAPHKDLRDWCAADKIDLDAFRRHAHAFPWTR